MKLSKIKTLKYQIIPLNSSICYNSGQLTGIAIMHQGKLAQWLSWKKIQKIHIS